MKRNIYKLNARLCLLFVFLGTASFVVGQGSGSNDKELLGEWVYENAFIPDEMYPTSFDRDNATYKFYGEIEVSEGNALLKDEEDIEVIEYIVEGNSLVINFANGESLEVEWKIENGKLQLEFVSLHPNDETKKIKLFVIYSKKNFSSNE